VVAPKAAFAYPPADVGGDKDLALDEEEVEVEVEEERSAAESVSCLFGASVPFARANRSRYNFTALSSSTALRKKGT